MIINVRTADESCVVKNLVVSSCSDKAKTPILLVPGMMGSSTDKNFYPALPKYSPEWDSSVWNTKSWGLYDRWNYPGWKKFVEYLIEAYGGYQMGCNIFAVPYDWREEDFEKLVDNYLIPAIDNAKAMTGTEKVNIVAHSMGGLLVRTYIQNQSKYRNDINKFAMVGTPNKGAATPYFIWYGGDTKLADDENEGFKDSWVNAYSNSIELAYETINEGQNLFPLIKVCDSTNCLYYHYEYDFNDSASRITVRNFVQKEIKSILNLMELFPFVENNNTSYVINDNTVLKNLNANFKLNDLTTQIFAGKDQNTISAIKVSGATSFYPYGVPIRNPCIKTKNGDGTVLLSSVPIGSVNVNSTTASTHTALIKDYKEAIGIENAVYGLSKLAK